MDETEDRNLTGGTHGLVVGDKQDRVIPAIIARSAPEQNEERIAPTTNKSEAQDAASRN
jgi:hypothetical protein